MKKLQILFTGLVLGILPTALASGAVFVFSDVPSGAWYESAVNRLEKMAIIQGYSDNTFKPENGVNRAELAVTLDRLKTRVDQDNVSNREYEEFLDATFRVLDTKYDLAYVLILAETGYKALENEPTSMSENTWEEMGNLNLPEGFSAYTNMVAESGNPIYLHFKGTKFVADYTEEVDEWYGPYYGLDSSILPD